MYFVCQIVCQKEEITDCFVNGEEYKMHSQLLWGQIYVTVSTVSWCLFFSNVSNNLKGHWTCNIKDSDSNCRKYSQDSMLGFVVKTDKCCHFHRRIFFNYLKFIYAAREEIITSLKKNEYNYKNQGSILNNRDRQINFLFFSEHA